MIVKLGNLSPKIEMKIQKILEKTTIYSCAFPQDFGRFRCFSRFLSISGTTAAVSFRDLQGVCWRTLGATGTNPKNLFFNENCIPLIFKNHGISKTGWFGDPRTFRMLILGEYIRSKKPGGVAPHRLIHLRLAFLHERYL